MLTIKEILQLIRTIVVEIVLEILSYIVVPIALVFTKREDDHLPRWARWFEDANYYYDGKCAAINGDSAGEKSIILSLVIDRIKLDCIGYLEIG